MATLRALSATVLGLELLGLLELCAVVVLGVNISQIGCCCFLAGAVGLGGGVVDDGIVLKDGFWVVRL